MYVFYLLHVDISNVSIMLQQILRKLIVTYSCKAYSLRSINTP